MIDWDDDQLNEARIDKKKLQSLIRMLKKAARDMDELGLHVYGQSGTGHLIHTSRPTHINDRNCTADHGSVVATIGNGFDGGDW